MIDFKAVTLEDQQIFNAYFKQGQYQQSECTFTNLYIWRECYSVQWAVVEGLLIIKPTVGEDTWILPPLGDYDRNDVSKAMSEIKEYFQSIDKPFVIRAITEEFETALRAKLPGWFQFEEERDLFDYVYNGDNLRELKGRKYHKKRNHLSNFRKNNPDYQFQLLDEAMIPEVKEFLDRWCQQKSCQGELSEGLVCEKKAIYEALHCFGQLSFTAAVIRINGQIEAFTMGEQLSNDMVVVHVEKANSQINGLYTAINQEYLLNQWPDIALVNREEDTGDEGLRKAKMSYYPELLVKKSKGVLVNG